MELVELIIRSNLVDCVTLGALETKMTDVNVGLFDAVIGEFLIEALTVLRNEKIEVVRVLGDTEPDVSICR